MFKTVNDATIFNQLINSLDFDKALELAKNTDIKFSYIDNESVSCFDCINSITFEHFTDFGDKLSTKQVKQISSIFDSLLKKEPHYWFKKQFNGKKNIYYFLNFYLRTNDLKNVDYFTKNIYQLDNFELEEKYINKNLTVEMSELIRNSSSDEKITASEISLAVDNFKRRESQIDEIEDYFDNLISQKNKRGLTYKHDEVLSLFQKTMISFKSVNIFEKMVTLFSPELQKKYKFKSSIDENFPHLSTRLDHIASRLFSIMNFKVTIDNSTQETLDKSITLPMIEFLQEISPKNNINEYVIGEFRYKFVPLALEFVEQLDSKEWTSQLGMDKENIFNISCTYFSNFFVHLLCDTLILKPKFNGENFDRFQNPEHKINLLLSYQQSFPEQFKKDFLSLKQGMNELGLEHSLNPNVDHILLYFKMMFEEENRQISTKTKKHKI